jgi:hypothetical protein
VTDGGHERAEAASLEMHREVAERLRRDPSILERARERVRGWLGDGSVAHPWAEAWSAVLSLPAEQVAAVLTDTGQRARDLRQTSPFAGALDARTRWAILRRVREGRPPA